MSACRHPIATSAGKAHAGSALSMTPADPAPIVHGHVCPPTVGPMRPEEHTSELQSLTRNSYADFCLKQKMQTHIQVPTHKSATNFIKIASIEIHPHHTHLLHNNLTHSHT